MNCEEVYNKIVQDLVDYINKYSLESLVLGISGGIDSTVCAAICRDSCDKTNIPLIGRSLPIRNKEDEFDVSKLVGETFCDDFKVYRLERSYHAALFHVCMDAGDANAANYYYTDELEDMPSRTPIANGNLQARCRMMYLYDIASRHKGIVIDTDNLTENNLGFFTIHGDQGDYKPIIGLWKTEVYELAEWIRDYYAMMSDGKDIDAINALNKSMALTPTDGLGISNSDLEQIGAKSYEDVDDILQSYLEAQCTGSLYVDRVLEDTCRNLYDKYSKEVVSKIIDRYNKSSFKRRPIQGTYRTELNLE